MSRFRAKTYRFSDLRVAEGECVEDFVSMQAAAADRTAKPRGGRPIGEATKQKMRDALHDIRTRLRRGEPVQDIAEAYEVPVEVVEEYRRTL